MIPDAQNHGRRYQKVSAIPSLTFLNSIHTNLFEFGYLIHEFQSKGLVNDLIGVGGLSMGGMTTCALLTHNPSIKATACLMGTPQLTEYRNHIESSIIQTGYFIPKDYRNLTTWVNDYDLSKNIHTLGQRPLFFWHGRHDHLVPFELTENFIKENSHLNIESHFDEGKHLVSPRIMDLTTDFFRRTLLKENEYEGSSYRCSKKDAIG